MRLDPELMRSGIVRRTVACFLVVALLPLGAAAILSLHAVRDVLLEQSRVRLAITADDYAAALHDRLLAIDARLDELARPADSAASSRTGSHDRLNVEFKAL